MPAYKYIDGARIHLNILKSRTPACYNTDTFLYKSLIFQNIQQNLTKMLIVAFFISHICKNLS